MSCCHKYKLVWVQYWEKKYLEAKGEKEQAFEALGMALHVGPLPSD